METNRLIVRLDKLLEGMPGEPAKRREHETAIVTWIGTNTYPKVSISKHVTFHADIVD